MEQEKVWYMQDAYWFKDENRASFPKVSSIVSEATRRGIQQGKREAFATIPNPSHSLDEVERLIGKNNDDIKKTLEGMIDSKSSAYNKGIQDAINVVKAVDSIKSKLASLDNSSKE